MSGVQLVRTESDDAPVGEPVGLGGVLASLDRRARRTLAPGLAVRRALTWDAADRRDPTWWPQGIAVSATGHVLAVAWYSSAGAGTRISFLDLRTRRYRHAQLVTPTLEPVEVHAGGLAWVGPWLYVAATRRGLLVCRPSDLATVPGRGLVLPTRFSYRASGDLRFSYCSHTDSELLVGEYGAGDDSRRLARFRLDPATGLLATDASGVAVASVTDGGAVPRTQGVVEVAGRHYLTRSRGPRRPGSVWSGSPGDLREHRWAVPMGPEDLTWSAEDDLLWTVTEHPRRRWIVGVPRSRFDPTGG